MQGILGVWFTTLVKDVRHTWSLVYYISEGCKAHFGVWFTTLVKDARHTCCLVYYHSEGCKAHMESGLLP